LPFRVQFLSSFTITQPFSYFLVLLVSIGLFATLTAADHLEASFEGLATQTQAQNPTADRLIR